MEEMEEKEKRALTRVLDAMLGEPSYIILRLTEEDGKVSEFALSYEEVEQIVKMSEIYKNEEIEEYVYKALYETIAKKRGRLDIID